MNFKVKFLCKYLPSDLERKNFFVDRNKGGYLYKVTGFKMPSRTIVVDSVTFYI